MEDRQYLILSVSEINLIDFSQILQTNESSLRKSIDETKVVIKWEGSTPSFVSSLATSEGPYDHSEILSIMSTSEWTPPYTPPA